MASVSSSGAAPDWCAGEPWASSVEWRANDLTDGSREKLEQAIGAPDAVVSCVGTIGFDVQELLKGNGFANVEAANAASKAGVGRFVYVGVAPEVADAQGWLYPQAKGYFDGKRQAADAIVAAFGEGASCVNPSFIYGGEGFGLFPPRVSAGYGSCVEELLSAAPLQKLADALPGLLKVALRPPVSVDGVAAACAKAALGTADFAALDGTAAINAVAGLPPASGLTDLLGGLKEKASSLASD